MPTTATATAITNPAPDVRVGVTGVYTELVVGDISASSVVQLLKLPPGAVLYTWFVACPVQTFQIDIGTDRNPEQFAAAWAVSGTTNSTYTPSLWLNGIGYEVSISAADPKQYQILQVRPLADISGTFRCGALYTVKSQA